MYNNIGPQYFFDIPDGDNRTYCMKHNAPPQTNAPKALFYRKIISTKGLDTTYQLTLICDINQRNNHHTNKVAYVPSSSDRRKR